MTFEVSLIDKNKLEHYYFVHTHEEVIDLINFAKERGQRIKLIKERLEDKK